ncbi:hypothetical protein TNCV_1664061 [Trichonephila clavipes]|uniref:Uncharacterized protein n=1 Tax=Trichonephila clavipes TaxID=2585209 RepID=A0A8X6V0W5_TRICX|nr:hypothetical protein TNCV_1664061 [Trichonephila clavipes]
MGLRTVYQSRYPKIDCHPLSSTDEGERILGRTWLVSPRCDVVFGNARLRGKRSAIDCIENDTTMEDDSFRQESPVNTSRETFFFPEFDLNKFSSLKSFLECFDKQCLEYQKDEQWKKQNIPRYLTGVYLKFWYENHLFEKSYQEIKQLLMTVFDATKQEDIRKFQN